MRRLLALTAIVLLLSPGILAAAPGTTPAVPDDGEVPGPAFLDPYGPSGERTDNPLAAVFTAVVVAGVIYRGLKVSDNTDRVE